MKELNGGGRFPVHLVFFIITILVSSCNTIKPIVQNDSLQTLTENDLSKFNGDYGIFSTELSSTTSEFALTYGRKFDLQSLPKTNDRINLASMDHKHLKVSVYKNDKLVKTKIIRGYLAQNYFQYKLTHLSFLHPFYFIINGYSTQRNRIGLLKNGDLTLDTETGGVLLLVVMPTFGSGDAHYNIVFKRKNGGR